MGHMSSMVPVQLICMLFVCVHTYIYIENPEFLAGKKTLGVSFITACGHCTCAIFNTVVFVFKNVRGT